MLMLVLRGSSLAVAVGTVIPIITGAMSDPAFVVPDILLALPLVVGALLPDKGARILLTGANAYALGIFSVAIATRLATVGAPSAMLVLAVIAAALNMVLIALIARARKVS